MIAGFMSRKGNYEVLDIPKVGGIEAGRPEWADGNKDLKKTARLWPHKLKGEGHFVAYLRKKATNNEAHSHIINTAAYEKSILPESFLEFMNDNLKVNIEGYFLIKGNNLYCLPEPPPDLSGIKVAKFGWYLGENIKGRFIPSHSMAISLNAGDIKRKLNLSAGSDMLSRYLKGETILVDGEKGMTAVCADGYTIGWGKQSGDMLKNLYPKGWRKMG
jgi:NOL1/NOP2/fmu family ribosome biogenesis protein